MSAPIYKINTLALRLQPWKDFFTDLQYNILTLGNTDVWLPETNVYQGFGVKLCYDAVWGPVRMAFAADDDFETYYYFSLGYEWDYFKFSRY